MTDKGKRAEQPEIYKIPDTSKIPETSKWSGTSQIAEMAEIPGIAERQERWGKLEEDLCAFTVPELCDGMDVPECMDAEIKQRVGKGRIIGRAFTIKVPPGEGAIITEAILKAQPGDILVIAGRGHCTTSYWGDHRSLCAKKKGIRGIVIDGAFRDLAGCEQAGIPIFAKGLTAATAGKSGVGALQVPVACGGIVVCPGDYIAADENGVCVIKADEAERILKRAARKTAAQKAAAEEMERTGTVIPRIRWDKNI